LATLFIVALHCNLHLMLKVLGFER